MSETSTSPTAMRPSARPKRVSGGVITLLVAATLLLLVAWLPPSYIAQRGSAILETVFGVLLLIVIWMVAKAALFLVRGPKAPSGS